MIAICACKLREPAKSYEFTNFHASNENNENEVK